MVDKNGEFERTIKNAVQRIGGFDKIPFDNTSFMPSSIEHPFPASVGSYKMSIRGTPSKHATMSKYTGRVPPITLEEFDKPATSDRHSFSKGGKPQLMRKLNLQKIRQLDSAAPTDYQGQT